ncbi:hypothetical protein B5F33_04100 [Collinsella sp. An2]|nr:hypothetical protein B5F33_04100 [Collinsella sp. An2]
MHICLAAQDCLAAIEALYRDVAEGMRGTDHDIWWEFGAYPTSEGLKTAMQEKSLFVAREFDGRAASCRDCFRGDGATSVIGAFVLDGRPPEDYVLAPWRVEAPLARFASYGARPARRASRMSATRIMRGALPTVQLPRNSQGDSSTE